jgi:DNA-directed RNA polymerase specialized sigma24 family protein
MDASVIRAWGRLGGRAPAEPLAGLMAGYQAGDADAFRAFHAALRPALATHLQALGARPAGLDEVLDQVFLAIHAARRTWRPGAPVQPWANAIADHIWRDNRD